MTVPYSTLWAFSPDTIFVFAQKMWWFLIVLGVLVAFHEYGHFLAARWVGVKVLKFSIGFGPKLFSRTVGDTEYLIFCRSPWWVRQDARGR